MQPDSIVKLTLKVGEKNGGHASGAAASYGMAESFSNTTQRCRNFLLPAPGVTISYSNANQASGPSSEASDTRMMN